MDDNTTDPSTVPAPEIQRAWTFADLNGSGWEALLYTDADLHGGDITEGLGPFQVFVTYSDMLSPGMTSPRFVLRARYSYPPVEGEGLSVDELLRNSAWWLNLRLDEQFAALLSLSLRVRMRSGGVVRRFDPAQDPAGRPWHLGHQAPVPPPFGQGHSIVPGLIGARVDIRHAVTHLELLPRLGPADATALLRAARHFANALWIVDADPEQAWLQLVTAAEVAATHHQREEEDAADLFRRSGHGKRAAELIEAAAGAELVSQVAEEFKDTMRATGRFLGFFKDFAPPAPMDRPTTEGARLVWEPKSLREALSQVYDLRSRLLHDGRPFPHPLLTRPDDGGGDVFAERPFGDAYGIGQMVWTPQELPMFLHTFIHMTQMALLAWWRSLAAAADAPPSVSGA